MAKKITIGRTYIWGKTSTNRINPEMAEDRRIDEKTKNLIKNHNHLSNDPKDITIFIGRSEFIAEDEGSRLNGHNLFWSVNQSNALKGAKRLTQEEIRSIK